MPEDKLAELANNFVELAKADPDKAKAKIKKYAIYSYAPKFVRSNP